MWDTHLTSDFVSLMDGFHSSTWLKTERERETMLWHASCMLKFLQDAVVFKAMELYRGKLIGWPMPGNSSADDEEVLCNAAEG